jgi:hypothetical protein
MGIVVTDIVSWTIEARRAITQNLVFSLSNTYRKAGSYMRKTVLWQSPHVRVSLSALLALLAILVVAGCGGGGGGGNNGTANNGGTTNGGTPPTGQNPTLPFLSGKIVDTSSPPVGVVGAAITLFGTGVPNINTHVTSSDGSFTIANVDPRYTTFAVISPDVTRFFNFALFGGKQYDTINCRLPLPVLKAGSNTLPTTVNLFSAGNNPPPPPPINGCP